MVAVNVGAIAERRIIMRLLKAGAVSVETAQPLEGLRWVESRRLQRLINAGVVHEPHTGYYHLDPPALADRLTARRQRTAIALIVVLVFVALTAYLSAPVIGR